MYVCVCHGVTDRQIREAAKQGCASLAELSMYTGCATGCGTCASLATEILAEASARPLPVPMLAAA